MFAALDRPGAGQRRLLTSRETARWVLSWVLKHEKRKFAICMFAVLYDFCFTMFQPMILEYMLSLSIRGGDDADADDAADDARRLTEAGSGDDGGDGGSTVLNVPLSRTTLLVVAACGVLVMNVLDAQALPPPSPPPFRCFCPSL